jgi:hypothetical protein
VGRKSVVGDGLFLANRGDKPGLAQILHH